MSAKKKVQKQKQREKEVKRKLELQREARLAPIREERKLIKRIKKITKLKRQLDGFDAPVSDDIYNLDDKSLSQIERNVQILKALEQEYETAEKEREEINQDLESKGLFTLEDKLNHLHQNLAKEQKDTAEVSVIKAPQNLN